MSYLVVSGAAIILLIMAVKAGMLCSFRTIEIPSHRTPSEAQLQHHYTNRRKRRLGGALTLTLSLLFITGYFTIKQLAPAHNQALLLWLWIGTVALSVACYFIAWVIRASVLSTYSPNRRL